MTGAAGVWWGWLSTRAEGQPVVYTKHVPYIFCTKQFLGHFTSVSFFRALSL